MREEKKLQNKIIKYLKENDIFYYKFNDRLRYAILDMYILYRGWHFWPELKSQKGKLSILQKREIKKIRKNGGKAYRFKDFDIFVRFFENRKKKIDDEYKKRGLK